MCTILCVMKYTCETQTNQHDNCGDDGGSIVHRQRCLHAMYKVHRFFLKCSPPHIQGYMLI